MQKKLSFCLQRTCEHGYENPNTVDAKIYATKAKLLDHSRNVREIDKNVQTSVKKAEGGELKENQT